MRYTGSLCDDGVCVYIYLFSGRTGYSSGTWLLISGRSSLLWMYTTPNMAVNGGWVALMSSRGASAWSSWLALQLLFGHAHLILGKGRTVLPGQRDVGANC